MRLVTGGITSIGVISVLFVKKSVGVISAGLVLRRVVKVS